MLPWVPRGAVPGRLLSREDTQTPRAGCSRVDARCARWVQLWLQAGKTSTLTLARIFDWSGRMRARQSDRGEAKSSTQRGLCTVASVLTMSLPAHMSIPKRPGVRVTP